MRIDISRNIDKNDPRITLAINAIQNAENGDTIIIRFSCNAGGAIEDAVLLISEIEKSSPSVKIVLIFESYAVSAAAFILCYFSFYNLVTTNVIVQLASPVCVVYHKPRAVTELHTYFASNLYHDRTYHGAIKFIADITPTFDNVFNAMFDACYDKKNIRIAPHMRSVYNMNGDVSVMFSEGRL